MVGKLRKIGLTALLATSMLFSTGGGCGGGGGSSGVVVPTNKAPVVNSFDNISNHYEYTPFLVKTNAVDPDGSIASSKFKYLINGSGLTPQELAMIPQGGDDFQVIHPGLPSERFDGFVTVTDNKGKSTDSNIQTFDTWSNEFHADAEIKTKLISLLANGDIDSYSANNPTIEVPDGSGGFASVPVDGVVVVNPIQGIEAIEYQGESDSDSEIDRNRGLLESADVVYRLISPTLRKNISGNLDSFYAVAAATSAQRYGTLKLAKIGDETLYVDSEGAPVFETREIGRVKEFTQYFVGSNCDGEVEGHKRIIIMYGDNRVRVGRKEKLSTIEAKTLNLRAASVK